MPTNPRWSVLAVLALSLLFCQKQAGAASLSGKVIEINDGDEITVFNLNRPVRIKLIGIDAPESDQAFGASAKQHLADLVFGKQVIVEYSGIGQHSSLIGRVIANEVDISAQMIRDGVAWFDIHYTGQMSASQREIYLQSEQAARSERRGLWSSESPVAPWEFVKAKEAKLYAGSKSDQSSSKETSRITRPRAELTNLSLMRTGSAVQSPKTAQVNGLFDSSWATEGPFRKTWKRYSPPGENFTALLPEGKVTSQSVPVGNQPFEVNYYLARDGETLFEVIWFSMPDTGENDEATIDNALTSFLHGVVAGFQQTGKGAFECAPSAQRKIPSFGYDGREFDLSNCTVPAVARIFTKVVGERRQLYAGFAFYKQPDDNVSRFLNSFVVTTRKN